MARLVSAGNPPRNIPATNGSSPLQDSRKFLTSILQLNIRNPDCFGMYVYNDSYGWGTMEVIENLLVDFEEAEGNWKEQWAMCEAIAMLWLRGAPGPLYM